MKLICELNDKIVLGLDGMSDKPPRLTARAIVKNKDGLYAVMYAGKFGLHSLPGGGIEAGEDALTALRREIFEETGCTCDHIEELGIVRENRASLDYTQINYYYVVTTAQSPGENHLTEAELASNTVVQWLAVDEMVRRINSQEFDRVQGKYLKARDVAALNEYINSEFKLLCDGFSIPVQINTTTDSDAPKFYTDKENGVHVITLNAAKIPAAQYASHAGYYVGKILLPRLRLETGRLILRRFSPKDAVDCFAFLSDTDGSYMDCSKAFTSMDEEYTELMKFYAQQETRYMIELKETSEVIGTINVFEDNSRAVESMEIGYSVSPVHQRKGYAFEALSALLNLLQDELMLDMVVAGVLEENYKSIRLLEKLGFQKEGIRHKAIWHDVLDKPVDLIYYYRDRQ